MAEPNGARRSSTLLDENGEPADWIELHNAGASAADISGWFLTDKQDNLVRWQFPAGTILPSAGYLVVFASGKDRTAAGAPLHTNFSLDRDGEFLALVDSDRSIVASFGPDFPYQFMGAAYGLAQSAGSPGGYAEQPRYLVPATPGHANGAQGPSIAAVAHEPNLLPTGQDLTVRATIAPPAPDADIILHYRFGFDAEQQVTMTVQAAGTFSAQIRTGMLPRGTLVRYYVTATNRGGGSAAPTSRWPLPCERPTLPAEAVEKSPPAYRLWLPMLSAASAPGPDTVDCPEYLGTVVGAQEIEEQSRLPILHWYVPEDPIYGWEWYRAAFDAHIEAGKPVWLFHDVGTRAAVFFAGQLYDNVFVEIAGAGTLAFSKKKLNFEFNHDQRLVLKGTEIPGAAFDAVEPFDKVHFPSTGWDESYVRQALAWRTYSYTGAPHSLSFVLRLQQNGAFFSVTTLVEHPHKRFLVRNGLEPDGTTFKIAGNTLLQPPLNSTEESTAGAYQERPDRLDREQALKNLIAGINLDPGYGE